jgi:tRNA G18 (ribose-2'-O)-methylase SpoU
MGNTNTLHLHNPDFPDWIAEGKHPSADLRNVIDHYKCWDDMAIRDNLAATSAPFHAVAENFAHDFNIATLVRNSNAFNIADVTIVGKRRWDRRGAVGTHHYTQVHHEGDARAYYQSLKDRGTPIIAVDNVEGSVPLPSFTWPAGDIAVVFGQEAIGVSNLALSYADACVAVPQRGSVRSMNVGACSAVIMYDYAVKTALI